MRELPSESLEERNLFHVPFFFFLPPSLPKEAAPQFIRKRCGWPKPRWGGSRVGEIPSHLLFTQLCNLVCVCFHVQEKCPGLKGGKLQKIKGLERIQQSRAIDAPFFFSTTTAPRFKIHCYNPDVRHPTNKPETPSVKQLQWIVSVQKAIGVFRSFLV